MWNTKFLVGLILWFALRSVRGASKYYTGEIRPYEFGFNLEGNQHRHEMKDARGIIMGEFGFITADGVYHVTVYATDEDGNFKVTARKNIRLMKIEHPVSVLPKINMLSTVSPFMIKLTSQTARQYPTQSPFQVTMTTVKPSQFATGCSGCKIPDSPTQTSTITPSQPPPFKVFTTTTTTPATLPQKLTDSKQTTTTSAPTSLQFNNFDLVKSLGGNGKLDLVTTTTTQPNDTKKHNNSINDLLDVRAPTMATAPDREKPELQKPELGGNSNAYREDQPIVVNGYKNVKGTMKEILNGLLYRFNYDVGYHGHKEEGDRQGAKKGEYYAIGRDGVKRIVSYEANEFGYQPYSKSVQVRPGETPQIEMEREAGLKGYEFKWFYA